LANFSYDPINYDYLKQSNVIDIFLQQLALCNDRLVLHGIAGICNCCLGIYNNIILAKLSTFLPILYGFVIF